MLDALSPQNPTSPPLPTDTPVLTLEPKEQNVKHINQIGSSLEARPSAISALPSQAEHLVSVSWATNITPTTLALRCF